MIIRQTDAQHQYQTRTGARYQAKQAINMELHKSSRSDETYPASFSGNKIFELVKA